VRDGDLQTIHTLAHTIKGSAASLSAKHLALAARHLEATAKGNAAADWVALFSDVQIEFSKVKVLLSQPDWIEQIKRPSLVAGG
jgi:HPt (histidine-containing phosphotransfer) domain-containing protein